MAYARAYFPDWTFSCCYPAEMHWDTADGDPDLQYFKRYNVFMPMWDDYGPMVYRSCSFGQYDRLWGEGPYHVYAHTYAMVGGTFKADPSKVTMWIGCTGCGAYGNETDVITRDGPLTLGEGRGLEAFARDLLILKHFGVRTVSIFHGMENFEADPEKTGFFDQYGYEDAFDRLDAYVNGPESTEEFTIYSEGDWNPSKHLVTDAQLDLNWIPNTYRYFLVILVGAITCKHHFSKRNK
jgi:hypothetical protein